MYFLIVLESEVQDQGAGCSVFGKVSFHLVLGHLLTMSWGGGKLSGASSCEVTYPGIRALPLWPHITFLLLLLVLGFWTQGLKLARQTLYHVGHSTSSFCSSYFWNRISCLCPDMPYCEFYLLHSCDHRHYHHTQLFIDWDGVSLDLWSSQSLSLQEARITGASHCTPPNFNEFSKYNHSGGRTSTPEFGGGGRTNLT
jgi:hypothetical protein